ncbi:MAG: gamma-glutamyl-gamma-aminobutyrate hydrolase family protein [Saprospiraceae bacterium]
MFTIGITESDTNFQYYAPFIKGVDDDIQVVTLSYRKQNVEDLSKCDGIVLSGGLDAHPKFYNHARINYPLAQDFNEVRDEWELKVFEYARLHRIPVLAICRGMQIVNIALGGDLIQDLEEHGKLNHRHVMDRDGVHDIQIEQNSLIFEISNCGTGKVNSAHHQGLGVIAPELMASAYAEDEMIEAVEYKDKVNNSFLLGVQWHPERLFKVSSNTSFSANIRAAFLDAVRNKNS